MPLNVHHRVVGLTEDESRQIGETLPNLMSACETICELMNGRGVGDGKISAIQVKPCRADFEAVYRFTTALELFRRIAFSDER